MFSFLSTSLFSALCFGVICVTYRYDCEGAFLTTLGLISLPSTAITVEVFADCRPDKHQTRQKRQNTRIHQIYQTQTENVCTSQPRQHKKIWMGQKQNKKKKSISFNTVAINCGVFFQAKSQRIATDSTETNFPDLTKKRK